MTQGCRSGRAVRQLLAAVLLLSSLPVVAQPKQPHVLICKDNLTPAQVISVLTSRGVSAGNATWFVLFDELNVGGTLYVTMPTARIDTGTLLNHAVALYGNAESLSMLQDRVTTMSPGVPAGPLLTRYIGLSRWRAFTQAREVWQVDPGVLRPFSRHVGLEPIPAVLISNHTGVRINTRPMTSIVLQYMGLDEVDRLDRGQSIWARIMGRPRIDVLIEQAVVGRRDERPTRQQNASDAKEAADQKQVTTRRAADDAMYRPAQEMGIEVLHALPPGMTLDDMQEALLHPHAYVELRNPAERCAKE